MRDPSAVARVLLVDSQTASVVMAFRRAGLEPIVLKGPSFATWLYDDGVRTYWDTDLLIDAERVDDAAQVLRQLNFRPEPLPPGPSWPAVTWFRPGSAGVVDLHTTIRFFDPRVNAYALLVDRTTSMPVGGTRVTVLDDAAKALHVVLHAVQDSFESDGSNEDLRRALRQVPDETWSEAATVASEVGSLEAFAVGLRALPAGDALSGRLGIPRPRSESFELWLRLHGETESGAGALEHLKTLPGTRAKLGYLHRKIFLPRAFARERARRAGVDNPSLTHAYLLYWRQVLARLPRAVRALVAHRSGRERS